MLPRTPPTSPASLRRHARPPGSPTWPGPPRGRHGPPAPPGKAPRCDRLPSWGRSWYLPSSQPGHPRLAPAAVFAGQDEARSTVAEVFLTERRLGDGIRTLKAFDVDPGAFDLDDAPEVSFIRHVAVVPDFITNSQIHIYLQPCTGRLPHRSAGERPRPRGGQGRPLAGGRGD